MEGLEISEVNLSQLEFSGRLDSEYYKRLFLDYERLVVSKNYTSLKSVSDFLIGPFGSAFTVENYVDCKDYRYIRGKDVKPFLIKSDDNVYMPKHDYERLDKYSLRENDILVSVVGTCGNAALITNKDLPAIFSCKSTVLRVQGIIPTYLLSYINCQYGRNLLFRKERGAIQKGLNLGDLKELPIFIPSNVFQSKIDVIFRDSLSKTSASKKLYAQAEQLLLEEIGLQDFEPSQEPVNIKSFADSFGTSGRLDAEYYQKKYDDIDEKLSNKETFKISDVFEIKSNASPKNYLKNGIKVIKTKNIRIPSVTFDKITDHTDSDCYLIEKNDLLFASMGVGSLGRVSFIHGNNVATIDGTIKALRTKVNYKGLHYEIPTLLFLTSKIGIEQIYKYIIGSTGIISISKRNVEGLVIPNITQSKREKITNKVLRSIALKKESEHLLEVAKRAVEMAIEEDEAAALVYINEEVDDVS